MTHTRNAPTSNEGSAVLERLDVLASHLPVRISEALDDTFQFWDDLTDGLALRPTSQAGAAVAQWKDFAQHFFSGGPDSIGDTIRDSLTAIASRGSGLSAVENVQSSTIFSSANDGFTAPTVAVSSANDQSDSSQEGDAGFAAFSAAGAFAELRHDIFDWLADFRDSLKEARSDFLENRAEFLSDLRTQLIELRDLIPFGHFDGEQFGVAQSAAGPMSDAAHHFGAVSTQVEPTISQNLDPLGFV